MESNKVKIIKSEKEMEELIKQMIPDLRKELSVPDGFIAEQILIEIARYALFENKSEVEVVDLGYDLSSYGYKTNKRFKLSNYKTVGDFLDEPNGETEATHVSGMGFTAKTIKSEIFEFAEDLHSEVVEKWLEEHNIEVDERIASDFYDKLYVETDPDNIVFEIESLPFLEVVERYKEAAIQIEKEMEAEEDEEEKKKREKRKIIEKIHGYVLEMAHEMGYIRFVMENKNILWNIIERLSRLFTPEEITIYLNSQDFRNITSRNLFGEINRRWESSKSS